MVVMVHLATVAGQGAAVVYFFVVQGVGGYWVLGGLHGVQQCFIMNA